MSEGDTSLFRYTSGSNTVLLSSTFPADPPPLPLVARHIYRP
jgi:hypothetical protein